MKMVEEKHPGTWSALIASATDVRRRAYAPYSNFWVGAALASADGATHLGVNVENCAYGSTICAERHAVGAAIAAGAKAFTAIAVVTDSSSITTPCGACLQVLSEMGVPTVVLHNLRDGQTQQWSLVDLLPSAPKLQYLAAKNQD